MQELFGKSGFRCKCDIADFSGEPHSASAARIIKIEETFICAVEEIFFRVEQREFILVRGALVGAECCAVAALVTHTVHVNNLLHTHTGYGERKVRAVRAYIDAGFADGGAFQTADTFFCNAVGGGKVHRH